MSSKFRNAGEREKWVSGNTFKFDTPRKSNRNVRQRAQLGISPWNHKQLAHKKPHKVESIKKTHIKKVSVKTHKATKKELKALLNSEIKTMLKKSPRVVVTPLELKRAKKRLSNSKKKSDDMNGDDDSMISDKKFDLLMDISDGYLKELDGNDVLKSSGKGSSEKGRRVSKRIADYKSPVVLNGDSKKTRKRASRKASPERMEEISKLSASFNEDVNITVETASEVTEGDDLSKVKIEDGKSNEEQAVEETKGRTWCTIA